MRCGNVSCIFSRHMVSIFPFFGLINLRLVFKCSPFRSRSGQREGLLSEATSEEVDQADPFYAHCKLHSDKNQIKYVIH